MPNGRPWNARHSQVWKETAPRCVLTPGRSLDYFTLRVPFLTGRSAQPKNGYPTLCSRFRNRSILPTGLLNLLSSSAVPKSTADPRRRIHRSMVPLLLACGMKTVGLWPANAGITVMSCRSDAEWSAVGYWCALGDSRLAVPISGRIELAA